MENIGGAERMSGRLTQERYDQLAAQLAEIIAPEPEEDQPEVGFLPSKRVLRSVTAIKEEERYPLERMAEMMGGDIERNTEYLQQYGCLIDTNVYGWRGFPSKFVTRDNQKKSTFTFVQFDATGTHEEKVSEDPDYILRNLQGSLNLWQNYKRGGRVPVFILRPSGIAFARNLRPYSDFKGEKPLPQVELITLRAFGEARTGQIVELMDLAKPESYATFKMPGLHNLIPDPDGDIERRMNVRRVGPEGEERNVKETRRFRRSTEEEREAGIERIIRLASESGVENDTVGKALLSIMKGMGWEPAAADPTVANQMSSEMDIEATSLIVADETLLSIFWPMDGRADDFSLSEWVHPWSKYVLKEDKGTRAVKADEGMCAYKAVILTVGRKIPLRKNKELYEAFRPVGEEGITHLSGCWKVLEKFLPKSETIQLIDCRGQKIPVEFYQEAEIESILYTLNGEALRKDQIKNIIALVDSKKGPHWLPMSEEKVKASMEREARKQGKAEKVEKKTLSFDECQQAQLVFIDFETAKDARDLTTEKHRHYVYGAAVIVGEEKRHFRPEKNSPVMVQVVEYLESLPFKFVAVMYNGRGFDSHFLVEAYTDLGYKVNNKNTIIAGSKYLKVGMERGNFHSSWDPNAFVPTSLDKAARDFGCVSGGKISFSHDEIEEIAEEISEELSMEADPNEIMLEIWNRMEQRKGKISVEEMVRYNIQDVVILKEVTEKLISSLRICGETLSEAYYQEALRLKAERESRKGERKTKMPSVKPKKVEPIECPTISNFAFSCLSKALSYARKVVSEKDRAKFTLVSTKYLFEAERERSARSLAVMQNLKFVNVPSCELEAARLYERIIRDTLIGGRCEITNPITLKEEKFSIDNEATPSLTEIALKEPILVPDINGLYSQGAKSLFACGELELAQGLADCRAKSGVHLVDVWGQPAKAMIPIRTEDGRWDWKAGANYPAHEVEMGGVTYFRPEQKGEKIEKRWLLSKDIEELLDHGAQVTWYTGFNYTERYPILAPFVKICDQKKNEPGVAPALRATWKIFQNSTYGKFLQRNRSEVKSEIFTDLVSMSAQTIESPYEQSIDEAPQVLEVTEMKGGAWFVKSRSVWKPSNLPGIVGAEVYAHSRAHVYNNYFYPLASQMPVRSPIACDTDSAFMPLSSYRILMEREKTRPDQFLAKDEKDKKTGLSVVEWVCDKAFFAARKAYWLGPNRLHEPGACGELAPYAFTEQEWEKKRAQEQKPKTRLKGCRANSDPAPMWTMKRNGKIIAGGEGIGEEFFSAAIKNEIVTDNTLEFSHWHIKSSRANGVMLLRGWKKFKAV